MELKELIERLNASDECNTIEAKRGSAIDRSVIETVCAFSNEPGLGGGHILLGVEKDEQMLFPYYTVKGIINSDKLQQDLASQCADRLNQPVRPEIEVEVYNGLLVLKIFVPELPDEQKPVFFKNEALPRGAYRRIGSTDQRCTEDDLYIFYNREDTLDNSIVKDTTLADLSDDAVKLYRTFRGRVNPFAEELNYSDEELLQSLGCIKKGENQDWMLTYCGLLVFGKRQALRRLLPMVRVDYIRVPGTEWVKDPENRFTTIDMRGPLIELIQRTFSAVADDLPKGFLLPEGQLQAEGIGLPTKVLREALVNAFIHRSYREHQPIQLIRYGNRIEIKNPGFSLKSEEELGEPGSKNRNPFIASIFHETNLAETKGSGIRTMRILMESAGMAPPTFESDHGANSFTARLLLHHFLSEDDLKWLQQFQDLNLHDSQKRGLIFIRETGAIDNPNYRQLNGCDTIKATSELRSLRDQDVLTQKGRGRYTYYIPGSRFNPRTDLQEKPLIQSKGLSGELESLSGKSSPLSGEFEGSLSGNFNSKEEEQLMAKIPAVLQTEIQQLGKRTKDPEQIKELICKICSANAFTLKELSTLLQRKPNYIQDNYVTPLRQEGRLKYTFPEIPNHPDQSYTTNIDI